MDKNKFSIVMPIHEYNDTMKELVVKAVKSVPSDYTLSVFYGGNGNVEDLSFIIDEHELSSIYLVERGNDFSTMMNEAVKVLKENKYEWFSILEFDDEFNSIWFDEIVKEIKDKPDVSIFLPLTEIVDYESNKFLSYGNEAPWASSFSSEIGFIDKDSLEQFFDFYLTGSVFNIKDWNYVGGLKESIKLSFWYEFLLRMTHNEKKVYVIPKLGYKHYVNREGSLFDQYKNTMDEKESQWWYNLALEEYAYKKDRKKTYLENNI